MYRIRFHGRGGQGIKTASRVLGTALFLEGYEVQDAPLYGAERRGAPILAFVRANKNPINERGVIPQPDLVVVADDSLMMLPAAGALSGATENTVVLLASTEDTLQWKENLGADVQLVTAPLMESVEDSLERRYTGMVCAGAAARLLGCVSLKSLIAAIEQELSSSSTSVIEENIARATQAFSRMSNQSGIVIEGTEVSADEYTSPDWLQLPFEEASISAPAIRAANNSGESHTGLWRTMQPVIDYEKCNKCWWVCSTLCPDGAIMVDKDKYPRIDLDHCKGCMVCVSVCPPQIIGIKPEATGPQKTLRESSS